MVIPAKVAAQLGGAVKPMMSRAVPNGIRGALVNSSRIAGQASFVPVAGAAVVTVAAPLITMAIAAGLSMRADMARQRELERVTQLLEKLHQDRLDEERNRLDGCLAAVTKATAILLDQGQVGQSIGLNVAVSTIDTAIAAAWRRLKRWSRSLDDFGDGPVEVAKIRSAFPDIDSRGGEFRAHLELAALAIALKRRVTVLQAVEQGQLNPGNPFERFVRELTVDQKSVDELENGISDMLRRLSNLDVDRSHGLRDFAFSAGEVDELLRMSRRLRELNNQPSGSPTASDVAIEMIRSPDGSVTVFPALAEAT